MFTIKGLIALIIALAGLAGSASRSPVHAVGNAPHIDSFPITSFAALMQKMHP